MNTINNRNEPTSMTDYLQWRSDLAPMISLDGEWSFALGEERGTIQVPGTWEAQGYNRKREGVAVYERTVFVPEAWRGMSVQLQFDAVSYHLEAEVNGTVVGEHDGMWTPFALDVTNALHYGTDNVIRLYVMKVGERYPLRETLAGFLPDVCLPFGGVWQSARLAAFGGAALRGVGVRCDGDTFICHAELVRADGLTPVIQILDPAGALVREWRGQASVEARIGGELAAWSPEQPTLYTLIVELRGADDQAVARMSRRFGKRSLTRKGDQVLLNGEPMVLRGVLNWGWYPEILCPAPDAAAIRAEFERVRAFGYNMVKLCLVVPSPLYFEIADEMGMLLWLELPLWLPVVSEQLRRRAPCQYAEILWRVHHHPSIIIYSLGCELDASVDAELLGALSAVLNTYVSGALRCDNSGSGEAYGGLAFDWADFNDYHFYCDLHQFNPLVDHFRRDWRPTRPWIFGEFCDCDDYRDTDEIAAAFGGALPWWLTEQNPIHPLSAIAYSQQTARMAALNLPYTTQDLRRISHQQSFLVRKTTLEAVRAKASMGGYVVTGWRDTPLATSSMVDDLGRLKYAPDAFSQFNADSVLLLEQGRRRRWTNGGDRPAPTDRFNHLEGELVDLRLVLAHGGGRRPSGRLRWRLTDSAGTIHAEGSADTDPYVSGRFAELTSPRFIMPPAAKTAYTLSAELDGVRNQWALWSYPRVRFPDALRVYDPAGALSALDEGLDGARRVADLAALTENAVLLTSAFTPDVAAWVRGGGHAVVLVSGVGGSVPTQPVPFWRESIKLIYPHPVMERFPHEGYAGLQFYHVACDHGIDTLSWLETLPDTRAVRPLIRRLHARQFTVLDYALEIEVGAGRLFASTLRFGGGMGDQVQGLNANIAGRYLLWGMTQRR